MDDISAHPLISQLENLRTAIAACPDSPEKETALLKTDRAIEYSKTTVERYEVQIQRFHDIFYNIQDLKSPTLIEDFMEALKKFKI